MLLYEGMNTTGIPKLKYISRLHISQPEVQHLEVWLLPKMSK